MKKSISTKWADGLIFATTMWLLSRLLAVVAMQLIAPLLRVTPATYTFPPVDFVPGFVPKTSWELFSHWDQGKRKKKCSFLCY